MNTQDQTLYDNLLNLKDKSETFYYVDQYIQNTKYRVFLYRLSSYTDFLHPDALWSRGTMFQLDKDGQPVRLACRSLPKFFNLNENPFTINLDLSDDNVETITDKRDGSLIASFIHNDEEDREYYTVMLKTKGSLYSEQAVAAKQLLWDGNHNELRNAIEDATLQDYTVCLEFCSPLNRIVLGYDKPSLIVLSVVKNATGEQLAYSKILTMFPAGTVVKELTLEAKSQGVAAYLEYITDQHGIEGVVVRLKSGLHFKYKAVPYIKLHAVKSSISAPRNLFEAVVNETTDDLKSLFTNDPSAITMIDNMQSKVSHIMNSLVKTVEAFYETNKHLGRKDYAVLGQSQLDRMHFALAMTLYTNGTPDYKYTLIKNYKEFNISDEPTVAQDE